MCQIYTVATLIRMYSVHTASVPEPVSVQIHPGTVYVCTAVILPSSPRWPVPRGGVFNPPFPFFPSFRLDQSEFGPLLLTCVVGKFFPLAAFSVPVAALIPPVAGAGATN